MWDKLDTGKRGFVTVHDVLKQAKILEAECPDFIREYESVARDGRVTRAAFLEYCVGKAATAEDRQRKVDMVQLRRMFDEVAGCGVFPKKHIEVVSQLLKQVLLDRSAWLISSSTVHGSRHTHRAILLQACTP